MKTIHTIDNAYEAAAGVLPAGWFAAVRSVRDTDKEFLEEINRYDVRFRKGRTSAEWSRALVNEPRRLTLCVSEEGRVSTEPLAEAERIGGLDALSGDRPVAVWTERQAARWRLMLFDGGDRRIVAELDTPLRAPSVARAGTRRAVACQQAHPEGDITRVYTDSGEALFTVEGSRPVFAGSPDGRFFLAGERSSGSRVELVLLVLEPNGEAIEIPVPAADAFNMHASLAVSDRDERLFLCWESCPAFGFDERVGMHRDLNLWTVSPGTTALEPGPGTASGRIYVRPEAFVDGTPQNMPPIRPQVLVCGHSPAVAFRRFRYRGMKCFGWDTLLLRHSRDGWAPPQRLSPNVGPPDAACTVLPCREGVIAFLPACSHDSIEPADLAMLKKQDPGQLPKRGTQPAKDFRIEIVQMEDPPLDFPSGSSQRVAYVVPPSVDNPAPLPAALDAAPGGRQLVWADLHAHSAYSKCMSANDGLPEEVLRFQRDVLGCRVLCLTEHVEYMTSPEFTHVLDCVESEAGSRCVPLYAVEWAKKPAHHTNFFAVDRAIFDCLRELMLTCDHLTPLYTRVKQELPSGTVTAIRHFHGMGNNDFGVQGSRVTETHDAEMECAMEAMQTRGNMMLSSPKGAPFPSNFLNAGAMLGLVGGSDHSRGGGPNRYCLTGLWVDVLTPQAVLDAILSRRTVACSNGRIAVSAALDGRFMGESVNVDGAVRIKAHAASAHTIRRACLVRDGQPLAWQDIGGTSADLDLLDDAPPPGKHWYSVTVEAESAYPGLAAIAHASPFFVNRDS